MEYIFIKPDDEYFSTKEKFCDFLCSNKRLEFEDTNDNKTNIFFFDKDKLQYGLECTKVEKSNEIIFHLMVKAEGDENTQATTLENLDFLIKEINKKTGAQFTINTIWNDVSLYYGEKLYPEIVKVENMLRKIIYLFMLKTVGSKWLDVGTPKKFQESINNVIEKNSKKKNEINADWLTYADFITLGYFFTAPYSLKTDLKALFKELKQYENIDTLNNETNQREDKKEKKLLTAEIIKKMSDEYEPKNNWDRYFSDKLNVETPKKFSNDWSSLYNIRNDVAHGKPITKVDFEKANKLIQLFTTVFKECIKVIDIDEFKMTTEEAEAVESIAQQVIQKKLPNTFEEEDSFAKFKPYYSDIKSFLDIILQNGNLKITNGDIKAAHFPLTASSSIAQEAKLVSSLFPKSIRGYLPST